MNKPRLLSRNGLMQLLGLKPKDAKMTIRTQLTNEQRLEALEKKRIADMAMVAQQILQLRQSYRGDPLWSPPSRVQEQARTTRNRREAESSRSDDSSTSIATSMLFASALSSASSDTSSYSSPSPSSDPSPSFSSGGGGDFSGGGSSGSWD